MEQLNRIEIRGYVGNVNILEVGGTRVAHFSVVTNFAYRTRTFEPVIEATWHNVTAWESKNVPDLGIIKKGEPIHVIGRLRIQRFTGNDGSEKNYTEIMASIVEKVDENLVTPTSV